MSPPRELTDRWNRELRYFHFTYAHGGPANDADRLFAEIAFDGEAALLALFETFGAALRRVPADAKRFVPGQRYATTKDLTFAIHAWPQFVEPGEVSVFGIRALVRVGLNVVSVEVYGAEGDPWQVTESDFQNALKLERHFERCGLKASKPASR